MKKLTLQEMECDYFTSPSLTKIDTISLTGAIDFSYQVPDQSVVKEPFHYPKTLHHNSVLNKRFAEMIVEFFPESLEDEDKPLILRKELFHNIIAFNIFSDELMKIFGWVLFESRPKNGYLFGYDIKTAGGDSVGFLSYGGNINKDGKDTYQIYINGDGCQHLYGVEHMFKLYRFALDNLCKIKRVDIALDDFDGLYGFDRVRDMWHNEAFKTTRQPQMAVNGNPDLDDGKGRTLYIGSKKSARYVRHYEKGKQLGMPDSDWVRHEVEIKNKNIDIPLETIIQPDYSFAHNSGLKEIFDVVADEQGVPECPHSNIKYAVKHKADIVVHSMKDHLKKQYGKWLFALRSFYSSAEAMLNDLQITELPSRFKRIGALPSAVSKFFNG